MHRTREIFFFWLIVGRVMDIIELKNFIPTEFVETETKWFYEELGIDDMYFQTETAEA